MNFPKGYLKFEGNIVCKICNINLPVHKFINHPLVAHKITIKDYYDKYLKKENEGICCCGKQTVFWGLTNGYRQFCSVKCLHKNMKLVRGREFVEYNEFICKLCNKGFRTINGLSKHLSIVHEYNCKDYYDKYLKKENEGICKICNKPTQYHDIGKGYNVYCCNSCGSLDPVVQNKNKETYFKRTGYNCSFQNPSVIKNIRIKIKKIRVEKGDWLSDDQIPLFHLYYRKVSHYTYQSIQKKFTNDELYNRRKRNTQIDHKYSIKQGFIDNILPCIIGSIYNLEILPQKQNAQKNIKCSITKEELFNLWDNNTNNTMIFLEGY
jgi:hypothetical protein